MPRITQDIIGGNAPALVLHFIQDFGNVAALDRGELATAPRRNQNAVNGRFGCRRGDQPLRFDVTLDPLAGNYSKVSAPSRLPPVLIALISSLASSRACFDAVRAGIAHRVPHLLAVRITSNNTKELPAGWANANVVTGKFRVWVRRCARRQLGNLLVGKDLAARHFIPRG